MQLLGKLRLEIFVREHQQARAPIAAWQLEAEDASWESADEVLTRYVDAVVENDHLLFSLRRIYKLDVKAEFKQGVLVVERVWTAEAVKPAVRRNVRSKA